MLGVASVLLRACSVPKVPASPLVGLWSFDETEMTAFDDLGPAGLPMTIVGTWADLTTGSIVQGVGGTSAYTNGGGYATLPAGEQAHALSALTVSFYYQRHSAAAKQILLAAGDGSEVGDFSIEVLPNGRLRGWHTGLDARLRFFDSSAGIVGTNLQVGTAHRIDLSLGPQGARIYLDGTELEAAAVLANTNGWNNTRVKYLGRWTDGILSPADGAFDRFRLWNRQLSGNEIVDLEPATSTALPTIESVDPFPTDWQGPIVVVTTGTSVWNSTGRASNTLFDARGKTRIVHPDQGYSANVSSQNQGLFWFGGKVGLNSSWVNVPYQTFYHNPSGPSYNYEGLFMGPSNNDAEAAGDGVRVEALRMDNPWDGIKIGRSRNFVVKGCYATHVHDDFVENDNFEAGTIEDCLVDGTYVFLSMRSGGFFGDPKTRNVVIRNCIVRLKAYRIDPSAGPVQGTGGLFKVHGGFSTNTGTGNHCKIQVYNSIFLVESIRYIEFGGHSGDEKLGFPTDPAGDGPIINHIEGSTLIWTGGGSFPGDVPASGVTVSTDRTIFENARDAWLAAHPWVNQDVSIAS